MQLRVALDLDGVVPALRLQQGYCTLRSGNSLEVAGHEPLMGRAPAEAAHSGIPWSCKPTVEKNEWTGARIRPWEAILEQLIETGPGDIASVFARAFDLAMRDASASAVSGPGWTRARPSAGAMPTAPSPSASTRPRARVTVQVPKTAGHEGEPCLTAIAGARPMIGPRVRRENGPPDRFPDEPTRDVEAVMREFGVVCLSSVRRSGRAAKLLDEELAARAATARSARSRISSSTRGMRRCAIAAPFEMSPSCPRWAPARDVPLHGCEMGGHGVGMSA